MSQSVWHMRPALLAGKACVLLLLAWNSNREGEDLASELDPDSAPYKPGVIYNNIDGVKRRLQESEPANKHTCGKQPPTMQLTDELWICIFAHLVDADDDTVRFWEDVVDGHLQLLELLNIRLVCKRFDSLYAQQVLRLSVPQQLTLRALPGLLSWLAKSKLAIKTFKANCESQLVTALLGALAALQMRLACVRVANTAQPSLQLLSAFKPLKTCWLESPDMETT